MTAYSLRYVDPACTDAPFDFEADDAASALVIACRVAGTRNAELWKSGRRLCALPRDRAQAWVPAWFVHPEHPQPARR